jgi:SMI1/KNR4 family protein SUKH-1
MSDLVGLVRIRLRFRPRDPAKRVHKPARPVTPQLLVASEEALGFELPLELKRLYAEIGNGGFGPGYGLLGLLNGATDESGETAVQKYAALRNDSVEEGGIPWPTGLLPICNWGCAIYSCINCSTPTYRMELFDPNPHEDHCTDWKDAFFTENCDFCQWIELWATGADLWERSYGANGAVSKVLEERQRNR